MNMLELELQTNHPLKELAHFYTNLLSQLPITQTEQHLIFQIGASKLTFKFLESGQPSRYHFAINIPRNQFEAAKEWLSKHVSLISDKNGEHVFRSESWNADMMYFYDPADNILELVARHTLNNDSDVPFSAKSLLNISEIGIAAKDVPAQVADIQTQIDIEPYLWSGSEEFAPVGNEEGLFIVVKQGRIWFPDTAIPAECLPVTAVVEQNGQRAKLSFS